ncbi:hypothetical protein Q1695_008894 [Nippostrongylus brasiliensis]|nr:hypothetical protein Q1695_008894 [Nippostrongylus brasiliensis]
MALELSIEGCTAVVHVQDARETTRKGQKDVLLRLKDSRGEILAEVKVPWPDGEPEPCEIKYVDSEECVKLTNNATFANVPLRISKIRELSSSRQAADLPKRFSGFSTTPILVSNSGQEALYNALKAFVREPVSDGKWSNVMKYLSAKGANADGFLTKDEQAVILRFIPTQSFNSRELRNICETLKKTNVLGPSCLASFYELCLSLDQTSIIQSVIDSSDALTEHSLAVFLNFVASNSSKDGEAEDLLLSRLLSRRFDARRMADAAARKISTQNVPTLLQKCMMMYVSPKYGDIAEQAALTCDLSLVFSWSQFLEIARRSISANYILDHAHVPN